MLNKGAFALEIVRGDPELTADCRVTLNRGDRIGSLDCNPQINFCHFFRNLNLAIFQAF